LRGDNKNFGERNREIERENDHCRTKMCISKEQLFLNLPEEGLK